MWTSSFGRWLIGLLLFIAASENLSAQYFSATPYRDLSGMPSNRIFDMCQTATGEIWMVTEAGVVRYDGLQWTPFHDTLDLPLHGDVRLLAMPDSSVFLAGLTKTGLSVRHYTRQGIWEHVSLPDELNLSGVRPHFRLTINPTASGYQLAIATENRLFIRSEQTWTTTHFDERSGNLIIEQLLFWDDNLFAATSEGLFRFQKGNLYQQVDRRGLKQMLYDEQSNRVFLLGGNWLGAYDLEADSLELYFENEQLGLDEPGARSNLLYHNNHLYYSYNSYLTQFDLKTGSKTPIITKLFDRDHACMRAVLDHENNLWVGTLRGAFKVNNLSIYSYNGLQLLENEVSAVYESAAGDIYLGCNTGINILHPDGKITKQLFSPNYLNPRVMDIVSYQGTVYLAANSAGVVAIEPSGKLTHTFPPIEESRVIDLHVFNDRLYCLSRGQVFEWQEGQWVKGPFPRVIASGAVRKLVLDDSRAFLLSQSGLYDFNSKRTLIGEDLSGTNIYNEIYYNDKTLLGTTDGIREINGDRLVSSETYHFPSSCAVYAFLEDDAGKLWAGTNQGMFRIGATGYQQMTTRHGLIGNEINRNALRLLSSGRMAIGTDQGVSFFDPNLPEIPTPDVRISHFQVNDAPSESTVLAYHENNLRFHFKALSYYDESRVQYRMRLVGLENEWQLVPHHSQRSVLYGKLEPGTYQLEVQARIEGNDWGQSAYSPELTIRPAFWDTLWFEVLFGVFSAVILYLFIRYRSNQLKLRNKLLSTKVEEKTSELHQQNQELVRAIQELKAAQGQLIQSEKLASMGHLTAGIAHELNNPLNYIRGGAECILKNLEELTTMSQKLSSNGQLAEYEEIIEESRELAHSIVSGANKSTSIVKSLSAFSADSQNFYSFIVLEKEIENALTLLNNQIGFRVTVNKMLANIPPIECYQAKINQTIVNVLLNALQAIEDTGEITIRLFRKDLDRITLEVKDNGIGLDPQLADKVFEPFFTTKDNNPGLGLTIARSIVQEHKGELTFESIPNKETKVCITLPINQTFHPELER